MYTAHMDENEKPINKGRGLLITDLVPKQENTRMYNNFEKKKYI